MISLHNETFFDQLRKIFVHFCVCQITKMYSNVVEARGRVGTALATQFDADGKEVKVNPELKLFIFYFDRIKFLVSV